MKYITQGEVDDMVKAIHAQRVETKACLVLAAKMLAFSVFAATFAWVFVAVFVMPAVR